MEIAQRISELLTWEWLALWFSGPLRRLIDRVVDFSVGGSKGIRAKASPSLQSAQRNAREVGHLPMGTNDAASIQERVDAKLFVVRDESGKERARLGVSDTGSALLSMLDGAGRERMTLSVHDDGNTGLMFQDEYGLLRVSLASDGERGLMITNDASDLAVALTVYPDGVPELELFDPNGKRLS
jgi:hypothetical protein